MLRMEDPGRDALKHSVSDIFVDRDGSHDSIFCPMNPKWLMAGIVAGMKLLYSIRPNG